MHSSTSQLVPYGGAVIEAAGRLGVRLHRELTTAQVETNTAACWDMRDLRRELLGLRSTAAAAAVQTGARLLAAGTVPAEEPAPPLTDTPRYRRMSEEFGPLAAEHCVCGCHVHVGVADRETAIQVGNHLRPWLPTLLALTANSAIHGGRDTGYASWRSVLWSRWPCSGPPPFFTSADHYDATVTMMVSSGAVLDPGMIYWDVRPSAHLPTIEVRVSDVPSTVDETALLATLVRGLVATAIRTLRAGRLAPPISGEALRTAYWRSARDGLGGHALDPFTLRLTTATQQLAALIRHIRAELDAVGEFQQVKNLTTKVLMHGNGAMRQRHALSQRGALADVIDQAIRATVQDVWPATALVHDRESLPLHADVHRGEP